MNAALPLRRMSSQRSQGSRCGSTLVSWRATIFLATRNCSQNTVVLSNCSRRPLADSRSEEHTSELQSRLHLVCRLLLEKKKKDIHAARPSQTAIHSVHRML